MFFHIGAMCVFFFYRAEVYDLLNGFNCKQTNVVSFEIVLTCETARSIVGDLSIIIVPCLILLILLNSTAPAIYRVFCWFLVICLFQCFRVFVCFLRFCCLGVKSDVSCLRPVLLLSVGLVFLRVSL